MHTATRSQRKGKFIVLAAVPVISAFWTASSMGQTLTWDANPTNPASPNDGSGNWNTTTNANWSDGVSDFTWVNGDIAAIGNGGTPGTITIDDVSGTVTANGINFNPVASGNYTIAAAGSATLTLGGSAVINVASGFTPTISAPIAGTAGIALNGAGTLNLSGNNTFTSAAAINSGTVVVAPGGNLGASSNLVSLGTPNNGTSIGDPTGALTLASGVSTTIGSFKCATNNNTTANTLTIASGATLNVTSNTPLSGLNSTVNAVFAVGSPNALAAITTSLTITGAGSLNVNGGSNNASFLAGMGNCNSSTFPGLVTLDMSGLTNFSFTTGSGAIPPAGGNEFAVGHGAGSGSTVNLAVNSTITAGTISAGDGTLTPGLAGGGPNAPGTNPGTLNLGSGTNTLNAGTILLGNGRTRGIIQWTAGTGSLTIAGYSGGASTANMIIGRCSSGTAANSTSNLTLSSHNVTVQAGTIQLGVLDGGSGSGANKGGAISFDTGTFNVADLKLAVGISGAATGNINGTFNLGNNSSSTGTLNVTNSFWIGDVTGGSAKAQGSLLIKGGTANIACNIIDVSTAVSSNNTLSLTGGTLNMNGFAIGTTAGGTGGLRTIANIILPSLGNNAVLMNLGGNGINNAGLVMNATGNLILEGTNTYTGGTTIASGTLQVGQASDVAAPSSALQATLIDNATLAFGSSQSMSVPTSISGVGAVNQVGTGATTLTGASTYSGPTALVAGTLAVGSIPNGLTNGPLGASSNAAANLQLTGGTLQYLGAGQSTDRLFTIAPPGGALDSSGSGPITFATAGSISSSDAASRSTTVGAASTRVLFANVNDLVVGMPVSGTFIASGTTIAAINRTTNAVTLSLPSTATASSADTLSFGVVGRSLTLSGSNTLSNTIVAGLTNSTGGGVLSVVKNGSGTWKLAGANTYTGNTTVNAGRLSFDQSYRTGASLTVADAATAAVTPRTTGVKVLQTNSVNLNTTGTLDLNDNDLVVGYGANPNPFTTIQGYVFAGYRGSPDPSATGIISSTGQSTGNTILALIDNALVGVGDWPPGSGQTIIANSVIGKYTYFGDVDLDGQVTPADYGILDANLGTTPPPGIAIISGDADFDGNITPADYGILDANLGSGMGSPLAPASAGATAVPEPALLSLALIAPLIAPRRRRVPRS